MLLYRILKVLVPTAFRVILRRVYLSNRKNIPAGKPVILAANHINAFLDGSIVSYFLRRKTYVLVRGDVFKKPWANTLLRSTGLLPIYRSFDGEDMKQSLIKNNKTFEECFEILRRGHLVLIFSEAIAKLEKRLRPIKKGTARMAFDAMVNFDWGMDLHIVPTAINFTFFKGFRKEVMVDFASPIRVLDYKSEYEDNPNQAIATLTAEIEKRLEQKLIIVKDPKNDGIVEMLLTQARNDLRLPFFGFLFYGDKRIQAERETANKFNNLAAERPEEAQDICEKVSHYNTQLSKLGLQDKAILGIKGVWWKLLIGIIFTIPAIVVSIIAAPPYLFAVILTRKFVRRDEFYDSLMLGFSVVLGILYNLILGIVLVLLFSWFGLFALVLIKIVGIFSLFVLEALQDTAQFIKLLFLTQTNLIEVRNLKKLRADLMS